MKILTKISQLLSGKSKMDPEDLISNPNVTVSIGAGIVGRGGGGGGTILSGARSITTPVSPPLPNQFPLAGTNVSIRCVINERKLFDFLIQFSSALEEAGHKRLANRLRSCYDIDTRSFDMPNAIAIVKDEIMEKE